MNNPGFSSSADKLVLIVDDDKEVMDLLELVVSKEGFKVETAEDGLAAQQKARALLPDIIILDLMLPKSGGFETLNALQAETTEDIPIIVITGRQLERSTSEMITQQPNVREFIQKPVKPEELAARLHQLLKTRPAKKP